MKAYIIVNNNFKINYMDDVYYTNNPPRTPLFFLHGPYVANHQGDTKLDIYKSKFFFSKKAAQQLCDKLQKKFGIGGRYFIRNGNNDIYPDSVGREDYKKYAPKYEVKQIVINMELI